MKEKWKKMSVFVLLCAVSIGMLLSLPLRTEAAEASARLVFSHGEYDSNSHHVECQDPLACAQDSWTAGIDQCSYLFLYFVEGETYRRLSLTDVVSTDTNVVTVSSCSSNANAVSLQARGFGQAEIQYTDQSGRTYSLPVEVHLPNTGFYTTQEPSEQTYIKEFNLTDENNTLYFVATNGWKLHSFSASTEYGDENIADVEFNQSENYAKIVVNKPGRYGFSYAPENASGYWYSYSTIEVLNRTSGLKLHRATYSEQGYIKYLYYDYQDSLSLGIGDSDMFLPYLLDSSGAEEELKVVDLSSTDSSVIKIETIGFQESVFYLSAVGTGQAAIQYRTEDGRLYEVPVTVGYPDIGLYKTMYVSNQYIFGNMFYATDSQDTVYLVASNGCKIKSAELEKDYYYYCDKAEITVNEDEGYVKIKLTELPETGATYSIKYSYISPEGYERDSYQVLYVLNANKKLVSVYGYEEDGIVYEQEGIYYNLYGSPGTKYIFPYFLEGENMQPIPATKIVSTNTDVVRVSTVPGNPDATRLDFVGVGQARLEYTDENNNTYGMDVEVGLPLVGYYSAPSADSNSILIKASVNESNNSFYMACLPEYEIVGITLSDDFAEIAEAIIDDSKSFATITVNKTDFPDGVYYADAILREKETGIEFSCSDEEIILQNSFGTPSEPPTQKELINGFVTRMYQQCLSREPDTDGLNGWAGQLEIGNMNGAQIAEAFVFSNEMLSKNLSDEEFVKVLYRSMMGREADTDGLNGWVSQLQNAYMTRSEVTKAFVEATEFTAICGAAGIQKGEYTSVGPLERFVSGFYTVCLGRPADQLGMWGWVKQLQGKNMNGAEIAYNFFFSEEFLNKDTSVEDYVNTLYRTLLGREADANGLAGWVEQLQSGSMTRLDLLKAFIESVEFTGLCEKYGIERGSL